MPFQTLSGDDSDSSHIRYPVSCPNNHDDHLHLGCYYPQLSCVGLPELEHATYAALMLRQTRSLGVVNRAGSWFSRALGRAVGLLCQLVLFEMVIKMNIEIVIHEEE